jgi:hypothetical protein
MLVGWDLVVLSVMTIARVGLACGRSAELVSLTVSPTYGGMLEGYPNARMNDLLLARASRPQQAPGGHPVHVITPRRSRPGPGDHPARCRSARSRHCQPRSARLFRSALVSQEPDPVLHQSWLVVTWFQEDLARPVADFAATAVHEIPWDDLASDSKL